MSSTRRQVLQSATGLLAGAVVASAEGEKPAVTKGRVKQSVMGWCFNPMPTMELAEHCKTLGMVAMEGIDKKHYPDVMKLGLKISLLGSHGFANGPYNPANHEACKQSLLEAIDLAAEIGTKNVITFTGMVEKGISPEEGSRHCVDLWKQVIGHAEKKGVQLCLEHLNTRDGSHPMKGHPGYFGDDVDLCVDLIQRVGSPNMKLLFDIYHVQVMHGDVIRRFRQHKDVIAHVHTAGNPGRCELDENQEIQYPAILRAILETGYDGYVAQEFIPTWPDKIAALRQAVQVCDV